jgi:hypothetical protein
MKLKMWKSLLGLWIMTLPLGVFGKIIPNPTKCGIFEFSGVFGKSSDTAVFKMYEGTRSEIQFSLDTGLSRVANVYDGQSVVFEAKLEYPVKKQRGALSISESVVQSQDLMPFLSLTKVRQRVPDPLHPSRDSQMRLLKELPCSKND